MINVPSGQARIVLSLCESLLRDPSAIAVTQQPGSLTLTWDPLDPAGAAMLTRIQGAANVLAPLAPLSVVANDVAACISFEQIAQPTAADAIAALQSAIRVIGHLLVRELTS